MLIKDIIHTNNDPCKLLNWIVASNFNLELHVSSRKWVLNYWPAGIFSCRLKAWPSPSVSANSFLLPIMRLSLHAEVAEKFNYLSPTSLTLLSFPRHISHRISLKHLPPIPRAFSFLQDILARHKRTSWCCPICERNSFYFICLTFWICPAFNSSGMKLAAVSLLCSLSGSRSGSSVK